MPLVAAKIKTVRLKVECLSAKGNLCAALMKDWARANIVPAVGPAGGISPNRVAPSASSRVSASASCAYGRASFFIILQGSSFAQFFGGE